MSKTLAAVKYFALFVGYPRSGHTLVSALLDAHPSIIFDRQIIITGYLKRFSGPQIMALMLRYSQKTAAGMADRTGFDYTVPGQWQGRFSSLRVIGSRSANFAAEYLGADTSRLAELEQQFGTRVKLIHVVRNPFDVVARISTANGIPVSDAARWFFDLADCVSRIEDVGGDRITTVHHEDMIADAGVQLRRLVESFGLSAGDDYLSACRNVVWPAPALSRELVKWPDEIRADLECRMRQYSYFQRYSFEA